MDLRSGIPYWRASNPDLLAFPPLDGDANCDVAVIGGGVTGALAALFLTREGVDTIVLDKGEIGCGSTAASTGLLQYEIDTPLVELIPKVGERHAVHAYRRGMRAIDELEALIGELGDRCGFSRKSTLYFASSAHDMRDLRREFECRMHFGFDVALLEREALAERSCLTAPGALYSAGDAQVDPYRLTHRALRAAQSEGLRAYANTNVEAIDDVSAPECVVLTTARGRIVARQVVFATGYVSHRYTSQEIGTLHSTYAAVSEPLVDFSGWPDRCLIWETARPYFYARQTDDGRAMIGGEDTPFAEDHAEEQLLDKQTARLMARFRELFPRIDFKPAYTWAGTFGETKDGLAYIGAPPGRERRYFALGYGGNGITFSMIAARLIADLIVKRPNNDAAVFRFGR